MELIKGFTMTCAFEPRVIKQSCGSEGEGIWLCWQWDKASTTKVAIAPITQYIEDSLGDGDYLRLMEMSDNHAKFHAGRECICCAHSASVLRCRGGGWPTRTDTPPACVVLCTGEGTHAADTDVDALKLSPSWATIESVVLGQRLTAVGLDALLSHHLGNHAAPTSPIITTVINIANADRWRAVGHVLLVALGHSVGEVAAAYVAGLLSVEGAISTAFLLGAGGPQAMLVGCYKEWELHDL